MAEQNATVEQEIELTQERIENIIDEDEGLDLLEYFNINTTGITDILGIKKCLRLYLRDQIKRDFCCVKCNINENDIEDLEQLHDILSARRLLDDHSIQSDEVTSLDEVKALLRDHLNKKRMLEPYDLEEVAEVVQKLMKENTQGRLKMLAKYNMVNKFVKNIPEERKGDISNQLPELEQDIKHVFGMLNKDNCTIMVAGETGAGKTCLLNLLLGELATDLLPVSNLPKTSTICEIKYDTERYLKTYPLNSRLHQSEVIPLDPNTAPDVIAKYASEDFDRDLKYSKIEVYWPCKWLKHEITITDTPGIGERADFTGLVKDYIPKASGFIYVINTPNAGGINPQELGDLLFYHITGEGIREDEDLPLGQLKGNIHFDPRSAIFVCNKWDIVTEAEQAEVKNYVKTNLEKVWRDFDFENQVFFISVQEVVKEIQCGYVPREYRRLLSGIQNLLPVGFKSRMEKQFWKMYDIMDRSMWVLNNYIKFDETCDKQVRKDQYVNAKKRLDDLEKRPKKARMEMNDILNKEIVCTLDHIRDHLRSSEVQGRLTKWHDSECPDNENLERLHQLQNALAHKRIVTEIHKFEQDQHIFENIQKKLMGMFNSIFVSVQNELESVEAGMREEPDLRSLNVPFYGGGKKPSKAMKEKKQIWAPLGVIVNAFALPAIGARALKRANKNRRILAEYKQNKAAEMAKVTKELAEGLISSEDKKLQSLLEDKLQLIKRKFDLLLDRIPQLIQANKLLLVELEKETESLVGFKDYIPMVKEGSKIIDVLNFDYLNHLRCYDIEMEKVKIIEKIGSGQFAMVYRGTYESDNDTKIVAVKRLKGALSERNATDFLLEELSARRIQSPYVIGYYGTAMKTYNDKKYPAMIMEYGELTLESVIFNEANYRGPGNVASSDPMRTSLQQRAARYADEICKGLLALHQLGIIHRDLKPDNILLDGDGHIKLCDLGFAIREQDVIGEVAGAKIYMAPEMRRKEKYDRSVDIFSFGMLSWEIWYGMEHGIQHGYNGENYDGFMKNPFSTNKPVKEWKDLFYKCCSQNRKERPTADECSAVFSHMYPSQSQEP